MDDFISGVLCGICCTAFMVFVILLMLSGQHESINVNALDDTCQYITNSSSEFDEEFGIQNRFACKDGNQIIIVGENENVFK